MNKSILILLLFSMIFGSETIANSIRKYSRKLTYQGKYSKKFIRKLTNKINKQKIKKVNFNNKKIEDAISWIIHSRIDAPSIMLDFMPDDSTDSKRASGKAVLVTLSANNITFLELINLICEKTNCWWRITDKGIIIYLNKKPIEKKLLE